MIRTIKQRITPGTNKSFSFLEKSCIRHQQEKKTQLWEMGGNGIVLSTFNKFYYLNSKILLVWMWKKEWWWASSQNKYLLIMCRKNLSLSWVLQGIPNASGGREKWKKIYVPKPFLILALWCCPVQATKRIFKRLQLNRRACWVLWAFIKIMSVSCF